MLVLYCKLQLGRLADTHVLEASGTMAPLKPCAKPALTFAIPVMLKKHIGCQVTKYAKRLIMLMPTGCLLAQLMHESSLLCVTFSNYFHQHHE